MHVKWLLKGEGAAGEKITFMASRALEPEDTVRFTSFFENTHHYL
jgi:hypothetical protein